jgi:hypothetical protein
VCVCVCPCCAGNINLVPTDLRGLTFSRTPQQVRHIGTDSFNSTSAWHSVTHSTAQQLADAAPAAVCPAWVKDLLTGFADRTSARHIVSHGTAQPVAGLLCSAAPAEVWAAWASKELSSIQHGLKHVSLLVMVCVCVPGAAYCDLGL